MDRNNIVIEKYSKLVDLVHKSKAISSIIPKGLLEFPQDRDCTPQKNKLISPRISHLSKKPTPSSEYLHKTSANSKLRKQNSDIQPSGTLSKKSENCNSAKELRDKRKGFLTEKNENHGSEKDARNQLKYNTNK